MESPAWRHFATCCCSSARVRILCAIALSWTPFPQVVGSLVRTSVSPRWGLVFFHTEPWAYALGLFLHPPSASRSLSRPSCVISRPDPNHFTSVSATVSLVAFDPARLIVPAATRLPCLASSLRYRRHNSPGGLHLQR